MLEGLAEIDFGRLEGASYDTIARDNPELYATWMAAPTAVSFPGGESYADLRRRVLAALTEIRERHRHETVAIVSHGGVIRVALSEALELPDRAFFRLDQSYGAITIIDWFGQTPVIRLMNGQAPMVARRRKGFLPGLALTDP